MLFNKLQLSISSRVFGLLVVLACTSYAALSLDRGWIPHDEGQLGHTAERILKGELPHRDYVEPYTGGLGFLNAAAFRCLGVRCESLRWTMLPFFVGFLGCVYWIARRAAVPSVAALVTALCTCLTLPVYAAGMPSWYNLFFATYGTAALLRNIDTRRARWLIVAGICGGCSVLIKITGLYFVAAALLFLAYREQFHSRSSRRGGVGYSIFASLMLAVFATLGCLYLRSANPAMNVIHFLLPWWALVSVVAWNEWRTRRGPALQRIVHSLRLIGPFVLGTASVILLLVIGYAWSGALPDLAKGLFVLPQARLQHAQLPFPGLQWLVMALPIAVLLAVGFRQSLVCSGRVQLMVLAAVCMVFAVSHTERGYVAVFQSLRHQLPIAVLMAVATLVWATRGDRLCDMRRQELFLLGCVTLFVSLVQYPYAGGAYFFYAAPLGALAVLYVVRSQPHAPQRLHLGMLCFVALFLVTRMHYPGPTISGGPYRPKIRVGRLGLERGNLLMRAEDAQIYRSLVAAIQARTAPGSYIFAGPDCPEVYFLAQRENPTKTLYDFFDGSSRSREVEIVRLIDQHQIGLAVIKSGSEFSANFSADLQHELSERFDQLEIYFAGNGANRRERFRVMWKSSGPMSTEFPRGLSLSESAHFRGAAVKKSKPPAILHARNGHI